MPKIEISTSDTNSFSEEAYKKALEISKNEIASLRAEAEKLYQMNQTLRIANEEMKKYIDAHKPEEHNEKPPKTAEKPFEDCEDDCDWCCDVCAVAEEHTVPDDDAVDIEIDHLIRENLDLEGRLKGMEDALHIALAWIKYNPTEDAESVQK